MTIKALKRLPIGVSCVAISLLSGCGGGGGSSAPPPVMTYQVTATAGTGGSITPASTMVNAGSTTTLALTANSGYAVSSVTGCGGTLSGNAYTTGAITAACTVTASFIAQYAVTATAGTGGTITPASTMVNAGGTTTLTVTPKSGYVVGGVTGCGGALSGTTYTTGTINAACTVTASFTAAFTWVGGSNTSNAAAVYGTQGVAAAANVPGARDAGVTWSDASGNLWMFGGFGGYTGAANPTVGKFLNELWKYSPSIGQWTWVGGSNTACAQGVYGTQGVAASTNVPGARGAVTYWKDASGNLWLYGGGGCDSADNFVIYQDLWEYSASNGQWTWVAGSSSNAYALPVFGTKGVPAATNAPGSRGSAVTWTDTSGNLWMFGGFGITMPSGSVAIAYLNDLWEYSPASGQWTWVAGPNTVNSNGAYGTQGVAQAANLPGGRSGTVSWIDANGNIWLFGGYGYDSLGQAGVLNDLWKYSVASGQWTWVGGSNTVNSTGVYVTQGVAATTNVPAARDSSVNWMDASGNLWLFGGEGYDTTAHAFRRLNDLWKYSPSSGSWTWIAGSSGFDSQGSYGTQGVAAAANVPEARAAAKGWMDAGGNMWLFGGYVYDPNRSELNDLWEFPTQ